MISGLYLVAVSKGGSTGKRPYRMGARADAAAATAEKILEAAEAAFDEQPASEPTLKGIAERADVTVQTILRRFGTKRGLMLASIAHAGMKMRQDRDVAPAGDTAAAIGVLVDHYDKFGGRILRMLAAEEQHPALGPLVDVGRDYHQQWCEQIFEPALSGLPDAKRERRVAQIAAVTDIYVWKLLRRDRNFSPAQTKLAICEMIEPLV